MNIEGKAAFITGAASGIGFAFAKRCAAQGAIVLMADIEEKALEMAATELRAAGATVKTYSLDVSDRKAYQAVADAVLAEFGAPYMLFNNAGIAWKAPAASATPGDWEWMVKVNVLGTGYGISMFVPAMTDANQGGYIVNTGSITSLLTTVGTPAVYGATKHMIVAISEALAHELRDYGIHVAVVCPGQVATRIGDADRNVTAGVNKDEISEAIDAERQFTKSMVSQGLDPDEVANQVFTALVEKRTYVITHGEYKDDIISRHRQIENAIPNTTATDVPLLEIARAALNLQPLT